MVMYQMPHIKDGILVQTELMIIPLLEMDVQLQDMIQRSSLQEVVYMSFVNNMGAHPFRIQMAYQNTSGQVFPHGVTNNAVSAGTLRFEVPLDAPNTLYYQCTSHAGMSGTITVYPSL